MTIAPYAGNGQRPISPNEVAAIPLSNLVFHVFGNTPTLLIKPDGLYSVLVIKSVVGGFNVSMGNRTGAGTGFTGDMPVGLPVAANANGTGAVHFSVGESLVLPGEKLAVVTVAGDDAASVITYWWA